MKIIDDGFYSMNALLRLLCCVLLLGLYGCMPKHSINGNISVPCKTTCMKHFEFCSQNCVANCPRCSSASTRSSAHHFTNYVHQQRVQGKKIMRELNSYRDPLQCRKVTCNCMADLMVCQQSCSGVIQKRLQAVPNCV